MSKAPDEVDAVLMRIATMKWQAVTTMSSSPNRLAREDAAAIAATLDSFASTLRRDVAPDVVKFVNARLEALVSQRDHPPRGRSAGRS
jgi:hypothetical protein